jgi:type I restriction-modification system DNA methylase subunit
MNTAVHNKLVSFIWSIADDCLRDIYVRGKYRDVILPMVVLRRLDALLEPTKDKVMEELAFQRDEAKFTEWDESGLRDASGYVFYNTSEWTLQRLKNTATNNQQILQANFEEYLEGFSANVKEIIEKFFRTIPLNASDIISKEIKKGSRFVIVLNVNNHPFEIINYGSGKEPSTETIEDAGEPMIIKWFNDTFIEIPIWKN